MRVWLQIIGRQEVAGRAVPLIEPVDLADLALASVHHFGLFVDLLLFPTARPALDKKRAASLSFQWEEKAHKLFGRAVTLSYAHLHLFLRRRTPASCERSAESFSRKGV